MIELEREICANVVEASSREWLETNGLGGYASSTIGGMNTRRYHGLLVAATDPPAVRTVLLSKLEETLVIDGERFELSANLYPGAVHPKGYQFLASFRLDPYPSFSYLVGGVRITKTIAMVYGENTTIVKYEIQAQDAQSADTRLEVRPLIAFRGYHELTHENGNIDRDFQSVEGLVRLRAYDGGPELYFGHNAEALEPTGDWYRSFQYSAELARGLDFQEDLFQPMLLHFSIGPSNPAVIIASTDPKNAAQVDDLLTLERARRLQIQTDGWDGEHFIQTLKIAANSFVVARGSGHTVIAGYHWFTDWGRDTMISLAGLSLATGRPGIARSIILEFARYIDHGMLPNRFPDRSEAPEYNTVDATLWYFEAIRAYVAYTGDHDLVQETLYPLLADIVDWHVRGTRYGIKVDSDGLLNSGADGVQLTWMDARVGDWVVTPRRGKPVEIQALWYNALKIVEEFAICIDDQPAAKRFAAMAGKAKVSFGKKFWNHAAGCLYDVIDGDSADPSIRPNQVFAISLHHSMLPRNKARSILAVVERDLLTPFGLRSLSPADPKYVGRYCGGPSERDGAYHQGAVWAWLIGPYITAHIKTYGRSQETAKQAQAMLSGFRQHLREAGLGQVSEIFDGDPPHAAKGCIAQAWSVAEILRVIAENDLSICDENSRR